MVQPSHTSPMCGACGKLMTPQNAKLRPELFLHDACLPPDLKPKPTAEPEKPRRGLDPELQAMAKIDRILSELDEDAQARVVQWIDSKMCSRIMPPTQILPPTETNRAED